MDWEAFGAAGEWAGVIAVVITLVYLARQIHQQNNIAKFNAAQSVWDGFRELTLSQGLNAEMADLTSRGNADPNSLSDTEATQYFLSNRAYFTAVYKAYRAHELEFLDDQEWHDIAWEFLVITKSPGGIVFREAIKDFGFEYFWKAIDATEEPSIQMPVHTLAKFGKENVDASDEKT